MESNPSVGGVLGFILSGGISVYAAMIAISALIIWQRTKSGHIILTRLWTFFYGKKECTVQPVANFLNELTAIHQFRYTTGIQVQSLDQINRLAALAKTDNQLLARISAAGPFYDLDAMKPLEPDKLPRKTWMFLGTIAAALLAWVFVGAVAALLLDRALLQMKATGTWFTLDATYAKPWGDSPGFRLETCSRRPLPSPDVTGFSMEDTEAICKAFSATDTKRYVETSVASQRAVLVLLSAAILYAVSYLYRWLSNGFAVFALKQRLLSSTPPAAGAAASP